MHFDPAGFDLNGEHAWLDKAVVEYQITEEKGRWHVAVVFINSDDPNQFLIRRIDNYPTRKKAELFARVFQKQISRDPRGTFKLKR